MQIVMYYLIDIYLNFYDAYQSLSIRSYYIDMKENIHVYRYMYLPVNKTILGGCIIIPTLELYGMLYR